MIQFRNGFYADIRTEDRSRTTISYNAGVLEEIKTRVERRAFLRVYDGRILLNDALLLQRLDPCLHRDSGYADFLPDVRVGNARIFYEQPYDCI